MDFSVAGVTYLNYLMNLLNSERIVGESGLLRIWFTVLVCMCYVDLLTCCYMFWLNLIPAAWSIYKLWWYSLNDWGITITGDPRNVTRLSCLLPFKMNNLTEISNFNGMVWGHVNTCNLHNKVDDVCQILFLAKTDLLCISETNWDDGYPDDMLDISGYNFL